MRPIPISLKKEIEASRRLKKCWICGSPLVEINHTFQYSGRQISELFALSSLCKFHHTGKDGFHNKLETKERVELMCLENCDIGYLMIKYPKRDWQQLFKYLKNKYGDTTKSTIGKLCLSRTKI